MKLISLSQNGSALARHEDRASRRRRTLPRTDYHFHAPAEDAVAVRDQHQPVGAPELRAFRKLSTSYLGEEKHRGYLLEMIVFATIIGLVAWPLISLLILLAQTANG